MVFLRGRVPQVKKALTDIFYGGRMNNTCGRLTDFTWAFTGTNKVGWGESGIPHSEAP